MTTEMMNFELAIPDKGRTLLLELLDYAYSVLNNYSERDPKNQDVDLMMCVAVVDEARMMLNGKGISPRGFLTILPAYQQINPNQLEMF